MRQPMVTAKKKEDRKELAILGVPLAGEVYISLYISRLHLATSRCTSLYVSRLHLAYTTQPPPLPL